MTPKEADVTSAPAQADGLGQFFREIVFVLGGVFAVRGTDDETIRQVAQGLERVYRRARTRTADAASPSPARGARHPAIEALLQLADHEETHR
jgi:hypothetical protein